MASYKYNQQTDTFELVQPEAEQPPSEEQDVSMTPSRLQRAKEALKGKFIEMKQKQELKRKQEQEAKMEAQQMYDKQRLEMLKKKERDKVQQKLERQSMTPQQKIQRFKQGASKVFDTGMKGTDKLGKLSRRMGKNLGFDDSGKNDLKGFTSNIDKITGGGNSNNNFGMNGEFDKFNELTGATKKTTKKMKKSKVKKKTTKKKKQSSQYSPADKLNSFLWR